MESSKAAWMQGIVLVAACLAIGLALALRLRRPFDEDTLAIQVSRLQSHAAEAQLLADNVVQDRLAPEFVRQHALQLADKVDDVDQKLQKAAQPGLESLKSRAQQSGNTLHEALLLLGRDGRHPRRQSLGFDALAQQFDAMHKQLKPQDSGG
jgi:hypothetical protein